MCREPALFCFGYMHTKNHTRLPRLRMHMKDIIDIPGWMPKVRVLCAAVSVIFCLMRKIVSVIFWL